MLCLIAGPVQVNLIKMWLFPVFCNINAIHYVCVLASNEKNKMMINLGHKKTLRL